MSKICIYSGILKFDLFINPPLFICLGELESKLQDTETVLQEVRIAWVSSTANLILLCFILKSRMSDFELCPLVRYFRIEKKIIIRVIRIHSNESKVQK